MENKKIKTKLNYDMLWVRERIKNKENEKQENKNKTKVSNVTGKRNK